MNFRERVVAAVEAGESRRSAARRYGVSESVAVKWLQRVAATGSVKPGKMGGYRRPALEGERDWLPARIAEKADVTVRGLSVELSERGVKASPYAVWSFFRRGGLTFQKSQHAAEQDRPDVARKRARWQRYQNSLDPGRLVFVDETSANTNMTRTHGRAASGERLVAKVPHGRWTTLTFIAALRCDAITAPLALDQPINGEWFLVWVEQALIPTLKPGDVVVLDNPGNHKGKAVRRAIRKA